MVAADLLADGRAQVGPAHAGRREYDRARPFDVTGARMADQVGERVDGDGQRAGADGDMDGRDADDIEQQRHGEDRAAAAQEPQQEADQAARNDGKDIGHGVLSSARAT